MSTPELNKFIQESLEKGKSKEEIRQSLVDRGWDPKDIDSALDKQEKQDDLLPPPPPPGHGVNDYRHLSNPLNSIVYIISFILVLTAIYSGMSAYGAGVDYYLEPSNKNNGWFASSSYSTSDESLYQTLSLSLATFIISLPIYLLSVWFLRSDENKRPILRKSWSRKFSAFLVILSTFGYCLGSLISLVYTTILGEVNGNDFAKFPVFFFLNFFPLVYYFIQLKDDKKFK